MKMKYLNKIIFINSANIPYAEISVDGNVHFTGTQGVGKSTVLRALLFFYNADKQHLGIQQGQKSFDEFYFRQSNSYILYEVIRDNGASMAHIRYLSADIRDALHGGLLMHLISVNG